MGSAHQLQNKLKALKLGGMLDTLELRLQEAQQGHLGYLDFLSRCIGTGGRRAA